MLGNFPLADLMALARTIYGPRQDGSPRKLIITPYAYPISFGSVAAGASSTQIGAISGNADFLLLGVSYATIETANLLASTLLLTDTGTGQPFTNGAVRLWNYASNQADQIPKMLPYPRFLRGRTSIAAQLSIVAPDASVTGAYVTLEGAQIRALD